MASGETHLGCATSKEHVVQDGGNGRLDKSQQVEAHVSSRVC